MAEKRRFLLAGNGSYANRGCEAIVRGTVAILRAQFGDCNFYSAYAVETSRNRDVRSEIDSDITHIPLLRINRGNKLWWKRQLLRLLRRNTDAVLYAPFEQALESARDSDAILLIGGDTFTLDYGHPDKSFGYLERALRLGKPVTLWGASIGPFTKDPEYERWATERLRKLPLILARESATYDYLCSLGLENSVKLIADPAFVMEPQQPKHVLPEWEPLLEQKCIGLNFSPLIARYYSRPADWFAVVVDSVRLLLKQTTKHIVLIPHVFSDPGDPAAAARDDYMFLKKVHDQLEEDQRVSLIDGRNMTAAEIKSLISQLHIFAGARTHSTIAALSSCVPTLCIGYSAKAKGIAKDIYGHYSWLIDGKDLDPQRFSTLVLDLDAAAESVRTHLEKIMPAYKARASEAGRHLQNIMLQ